MDSTNNNIESDNVQPRVRMISYTKNAKLVLYLAFKECYSKQSSIDRIDTIDYPNDSIELSKELKKLLSYGHESPIEHVSATFSIDGISRACSHQLVRHRIASFSQKSQRYVNTSDMNTFVIPDTIKTNKLIQNDYLEILDKIKSFIRFYTNKVKSEDLRMMLPNATTTSLIVTMNARELLHFFRIRCCKRAQWEIRKVAYLMLDQCRTWLPEVFEKAGPSCESIGVCFEDPKLSCKPLLTLDHLLYLRQKEDFHHTEKEYYD